MLTAMNVILSILLVIYIFLLFKYKEIKNISKLEGSFLLLTLLFIFKGEIFYIRFSPLFIIIILYFMYKRFRNIKYTIEAYQDINYLNRDIDTKYNPSIISYLINGNLHSSSLVADIMNLYASKLIDIEKVEKNGNIKYYLKLGEKFNEKEHLCESDQYIIDTLITNRGKLFNKFDFKEWSLKVINDYRNSDLLGEKILKFLLIALTIVVIISVLAFFIFCCTINMSFIGFIASLLIIFLFISARRFLISSILTYNDICLTKHGKEELKKWMKFKKFMEEYTLIKDKTIEDIPIYEHYIPYSVALRIVNDYENTIFRIFRDFEIELIPLGDTSFVSL